MIKLGAFYTCYDELEATRVSITFLRRVYPGIPIYLNYESDMNFKFLESEMSNIVTLKGEDTLSEVLNMRSNNFRSDKQQVNIKKAVVTVLDRLTKAISFLKSEYIIMLDPDAIVVGNLTIPNDVGLLGCRCNSYPYVLDDLNTVLTKYGGIPLTAWGATPGIFNVDKFLKAKLILEKNPDIINELCYSFYAIFAHDILLPSLFSLIGESETFNPDIVQITSNPKWHETSYNLLHQYREYYPKRASKYHNGELG